MPLTVLADVLFRHMPIRGMGRTWGKFSSLPAKKPRKFETATGKENFEEGRINLLGLSPLQSEVCKCQTPGFDTLRTEEGKIPENIFFSSSD